MAKPLPPGSPRTRWPSSGLPGSSRILGPCPSSCFAFRHFPLANIHPHAQRAAEAAEAAGAQGQFWRMHDRLFEEQQALEVEDLTRYAEELGLDLARFETEILTGAHRERVREDFRLGARGGVNGTPSFFINGTRYDGLRGLDPLLAALNEARGW